MQERTCGYKMNNSLPSVAICPVARISPSTYCNLQSCKLKGILYANHFTPLLPASPSTRLGSAIHVLFELAEKGMVSDDEHGLECAWKSEIERVESKMIANKLEAHLVPLELSAANFDVKKIIAFNALRSFTQRTVHVKPKTTNIEPEKWVETDDGKVCGRIDLIKKYDKHVEIIDYKTGNIADNSSDGFTPKKEYQQQLKLYAALYFVTSKIWPSQLVLVDLNQKRYEVDFTPDECMTLLERTRKELEEVNELIDVGCAPEDFAQPSPGSCRFCTFRPACCKYWEKRSGGNGWPLDVCGDIKEKKILGNGSFKVVIADRGGEITIRGLSQRHSFLNNNIHKVLFCNLGQDTSDNHLVEMPLTAGYALGI